jgi:hypothetical protein
MHRSISKQLQTAMVALSLLPGAALPGCHRPKGAQHNPLPKAVPTASFASREVIVPSTTASAPLARPLAPELRKLLDEWFAATNAADAKQLAELYVPQLVFYGRRLARGEAITHKRQAAVLQELLHEGIIAVPQMAGRTRIEFRKRVTSAGKFMDYDAYLIVGPSVGKLRIFEESDRNTDVHLGTGPCEYVIQRTLQEFLGAQMPAVDGFTTSRSPEEPGSHEREYEFDIGFTGGSEAFHNAGIVRVAPASGAIQYDCASSLYDFPPCRNLKPGIFHSIAFTPSRAPSTEPACAAVVARLAGQRR